MLSRHIVMLTVTDTQEQRMSYAQFEECNKGEDHDKHRNRSDTEQYIQPDRISESFRLSFVRNPVVLPVLLLVDVVVVIIIRPL